MGRTALATALIGIASMVGLGGSTVRERNGSDWHNPYSSGKPAKLRHKSKAALARKAKNRTARDSRRRNRG